MCLYLAFFNFKSIKVENLRFSPFYLFLFAIAVSSLTVHSYASRSSASDFCSKSSRPETSALEMIQGARFI